jgi:hypothetical protein
MRQNRDMAHNWKTTSVDAPFLGRDEMVCFIEDTPERWHAYPAPRGREVEVQAR